MDRNSKFSGRGLIRGVLIGAALAVALPASGALTLSDTPLFVTQSVPPLSLLVMGRDHKLYYEAYNDASDLDGDGQTDVRYKPGSIDYYGYFDSYKCYSYDSSDARFEPSALTANKTCAGASEWSGDYLNYVAMSRMDPLRKVLYGGYRSTDTATVTVLERSHIPQDAHSWGKEYTSVAADGYDIRDYTPLDLPNAGQRHLLANTTLLNTTEPLLRVLVNSSYRIWEWVSIERPVAGSKCLNGGSGPDCANAAGNYDTHPNNHAEYDAMIAEFANASHLQGSGSPVNGQINGSGNPYGSDDYYLTVFEGSIVVGVGGTYEFAVDGDDALEVIINGTVVASWYGGHGNCNCTTYSGSINLSSGSHTVEFRHQERGGGDNYYLHWKGPDSGNNWELVPALSYQNLTLSTYDVTRPASTLTDYSVRVQVCDATMPEDNCKLYPDGNYKPTGILHDFGEDEKMYFGLLTGSYEKNLSGGVLRKRVGSFTDEVDPDNGVFTATVGIVKTIDRLKTTGFGGNYEYGCGWITTRAINGGECAMWGNPVGEMMYEGMRYFAGKSAATSAYSIASSGNDDATLGLPLASWHDPYDANTGYPSCSKPFQLVLSDINVSYDTNEVPGTAFGSFTGDVTGFDAEASANTISTNEGNIANTNRFIGQSGNTYDGAPTAKTVTSLGNVRGLAPEEPTKQGGYYAASVAYHGLINDISAASGDQNLNTFTVALASPLPRIEIPVGGTTITLVPFAKSVGGSGISAAQGDFQPTNQIVDFYVESLTATSGNFGVNFEDVEQGADHDMDAIAAYSYVVNNDNTVTITVNSTYAAGGIIQHMGYVISGTTADGTYLEVRDVDTAVGTDPDYFLDTPPGSGPGGTWNDGADLPLTATRTFVPSNSSGATILTNPLWYAAKWGGFTDEDGDDLPDPAEWDANSDGDPDNYYLVTNALGLKDQLSAAFVEVLERVGSASAVATNSTRLDTNSLLYQARFNTADWGGELLAYSLDNVDGAISSAQWDAGDLIPAHTSRSIYTYDPADTSGSPGRSFVWDSNELNATQMAALNTDHFGTADAAGQEKGSQRLAWLRGDPLQEKQNGGLFRNRTTVLGDIVNSDPWFVGDQDFGYTALPSTEGSSYLSFRQSSAYLNRYPMVYVGANDAQVHGFHASTGVEKFAYVPAALFPRLSKLPNPDYSHEYFVDGQLRHGDAYIDVGAGNEWRTLLVGALGAGGRGLFTLDVTNPNSFGKTNVLWEFTNADDGDLGYTIGQAAVVRMSNGKWAVIAGNGYNSDNQRAALFILDAEDGSIIKKIDTGAGSGAAPNGLATPTPVDANGDRVVDYIYAGDLLGNMWKFDVSHTNPTQWDIPFSTAGTDQPLFRACTTDPCGSNFQPISAKPQVGLHPDGGLMVYFGTGKFFQAGDNIVGNSPQTQTFYGIRDQATLVSGRNALQQQTILAELPASSTGFNSDVRVSTDTAVDYTVKSGWYMDLVSPTNGAEGERVVSAPVLRSGRVIFATLIPSGDPCDFGGNSWLMELDAVGGKRLDVTPFDLNDDGAFDSGDYVTVVINGVSVTVPVSGKKSNIGIIKTPGIVDGGDEDHKYTSGSSGNLEHTLESSSEYDGRQSWRQLR